MKQETFLIVGITTILTMAFFLGGKEKSCAQRLFTSTQQEYKFISIEMAEQQTDTLTTNY
jgi:Mg2+/citrate symporter